MKALGHIILGLVGCGTFVFIPLAAVVSIVFGALVLSKQGQKDAFAAWLGIVMSMVSLMGWDVCWFSLGDKWRKRRRGITDG